MNQAISSTNVVLNTAISPTLWLIPSSLIILKEPIDGYNNKLKVSDENMVFGINENLNYYGKTPSSPVKKQYNLSVKKLEKLGDKQQSKDDEKSVKSNETKNLTKTSMSTENFIILSLSMIGGILISKYLLLNK